MQEWDLFLLPEEGSVQAGWKQSFQGISSSAMIFSRLHDDIPHYPLVCAQFVWIQQWVTCCSVVWWQMFGFARKRCVLLIGRILMQICFLRGTHQLGGRVAFNNVCVKQPRLLLDTCIYTHLAFSHVTCQAVGTEGMPLPTAKMKKPLGKILSAVNSWPWLLTCSGAARTLVQSCYAVLCLLSQLGSWPCPRQHTWCALRVWRSTGIGAVLLILQILILQRLWEDGRGVPFLILANAPVVSASDMAFPCCPFCNQVQAELPLLLFFRKVESKPSVRSWEERYCRSPPSS